MLQYLAKFLEDRLIKVVVNVRESDWMTVDNGILQGPVISSTCKT